MTTVAETLALFLVAFLLISVGFALAFLAVAAVDPSWPALSNDAWASIFLRPHVTRDDGASDGVFWTIASAMSVPFWSAVGEVHIVQMAATSPLLSTLLLWAYVAVSQVGHVRIQCLSGTAIHPFHNAYAHVQVAWILASHHAWGHELTHRTPYP